MINKKKLNEKNKKKKKMEDPKRPKIPKNKIEIENTKCLYVVLENASLEAVKVGKSYQLLSADEHGSILKKHKRDPAEARPDITHQVKNKNKKKSIFLFFFSKSKKKIIFNSPLFEEKKTLHKSDFKKTYKTN